MAKDSFDYSKTLAGQLLVATPQMTDPRFQKRALFICQHDETAAMGFIINQPSEEVTISTLSDQLKIDQPRFDPNAPVYIGGPVEPQRGYILHTDDQMMPNSTEDAHIWDKTFMAMGINAGSLSPQSGSA